MNQLKHLREERAKIQEQLDAIFSLCEKEKRSRNENEKKQYDDLVAKEEAMNVEIADLEKHEERKKILAASSTPVTFDTPGKDYLGKEERKNVKRLSIAKAMGEIRSNNFTGVEKEINEQGKEQLRAIGKGTSEGFSIPSELVVWGQKEKRDLTIGTEGGDIMDKQFGALIPVLRPNPLLASLGTQFLTGLGADFQLPRQSAAATMAWQTETGASTESTPTFDNITLTPKRCSGYIDIARQAMIQSSFALENWVRNELSTALAQEIDRVGINGSGSSNEPTGLLNTSSIGSVSMGASVGGAPTWAKMVEFTSTAAIANADFGSIHWLTTPQAKAKMLVTPKQSSGVEGNFILAEPGNSLLGYSLHASNLVPSTLVEGGSGSVLSAIIFGNFNELYVGQFGAINLMSDPYGQMINGIVRFYIELFADVKLRHAASFTCSLDTVTT